jgi:ABC-type lipoprotein export system ATPase subunit
MIFKIKHLSCSYDGKTPVLCINDLFFEKGKIHTIIGLSGSGKSTILETLGLMNNTIMEGDVEFYDGNYTPIHYLNLWSSKNEDHIVDIRKQHFSFIFQSTNLMRNFSAYDNICLSQMIQGYSLKESRERADVFLKKTNLYKVINNRPHNAAHSSTAGNLNNNAVKTEKLINSISGGERQRLAFIRAIAPEYSVLLCDEPTGNLDNMNAKELMKIIRQQIRDENKTAIIVSHQLDLAVEFSDILILIKKGAKDPFGQIKSQYVFKKEETNKWMDHQDNKVENIYTTINNLLFNE